MQFATVALGGTFDRLHSGHRQLLLKAFEVSDYVIIGLTSDDFVGEKKRADLIQPYKQRHLELVKFLDSHKFQGRFEVIKLDDTYGNTLNDSRLEALIVSQQTISGGEKINKKRAQRNLKPLPLVVTPMVTDESGEHISSTRLRNGLINRQGQVYWSVFHQDYYISPDQKRILEQPMGPLIDLETFEFSRYTAVAVVGDVSLSRFIALKKPFDYGVYDNLSGRQKMVGAYEFERMTRFISENPSGVITSQSVIVLKHLLTQDQGLLEIEGEEDLLVLPMLLLLPLQSLILYGQPNQGLVAVESTEENKEKWYDFLKHPTNKTDRL